MDGVHSESNGIESSRLSERWHSGLQCCVLRAVATGSTGDPRGRRRVVSSFQRRRGDTESGWSMCACSVNGEVRQAWPGEAGGRAGSVRARRGRAGRACVSTPSAGRSAKRHVPTPTFASVHVHGFPLLQTHKHKFLKPL